MRNRVFRALICLVVICALIFNISPIQAEAVAGEGLAGALAAAGFGSAAVPAVIVVAGVIVALGLYAEAQEHQLELQYLAEQCVDSLTATGMIVGDTVTGWIKDGKSYFDETIVKAVRDWLWSDGVLSLDNLPFPDTIPSNIQSRIDIASDKPFAFLMWDMDLTTFSVGYSSSAFTLTYDGGNYYVIKTINASNYYFSYSGGNWDTRSNTMIDVSQYSLSFFGTDYVPGVTTTTNLALADVVAPPDTTIETGYESVIVTPGIVIELGPNDPDPEDPNKTTTHPFWPIHTTDRIEDMLQLDQETAWDGETTLEPETDTEPDATTATDPSTDPDTGTDTDPDTGTTTNPDSDWKPDGDVGHFTLDLTDYFPFCIPFDLYDFLCCLNADPVTPVIDWGVPLPDGSIYPIKVDLSEFDSIAQLLRRLQLLLFCIGLAAKTRDLIKG